MILRIALQVPTHMPSAVNAFFGLVDLMVLLFLLTWYELIQQQDNDHSRCQLLTPRIYFNRLFIIVFKYTSDILRKVSLYYMLTNDRDQNSIALTICNIKSSNLFQTIMRREIKENLFEILFVIWIKYIRHRYYLDDTYIWK